MEAASFFFFSQKKRKRYSVQMEIAPNKKNPLREKWISGLN
jgi:hypothetical protein